jgi:hypothetical protein
MIGLFLVVVVAFLRRSCKTIRRRRAEVRVCAPDVEAIVFEAIRDRMALDPLNPNESFEAEQDIERGALSCDRAVLAEIARARDCPSIRIEIMWPPTEAEISGGSKPRS